MSTRKRRATGAPSTEVAHCMADAVTYLSRVADDAVLRDISADLLTIRKRLVRKAERKSVDLFHNSREVETNAHLRRIK